MVPLSKSGGQQCLVGSNPTLSGKYGVQDMKKEQLGKIMKVTGLALTITGPAMTTHHRVSYGRWHDGKNPCHGRAGLTLTGLGIPLIIAGHELGKRGKFNL